MDHAALAPALDSLERRLDKVALHPGEVRVGLDGLARPVLRVFRWRARFEHAALDALGAACARASGDANEDGDSLEDAVAWAVAELGTNVRRAERHCAVHGRSPFAEVAWMGRVVVVLREALVPALAVRAGIGAPARSPGTSAHPGGERAGSAATYLAAVDALRLAPPLCLASPRPLTPRARAAAAVEAAAGERIALELAAIDRTLDAARAEQRLIGRRRRLLEGARRLLLDADAALRLDLEGVGRRKVGIASQIVELDALELPRAMRIGELLRRFVPRRGIDVDAALAESRERSAAELFGERVVTAVDEAYAATRASAALKKAPGAAKRYFGKQGPPRTFAACLAVDGCFDVGVPLAPVRVAEIERRVRVVRHPTPEMLLTRARGPEDVSIAVVDDPRLLWLDLAAGRLLARKFVAVEEVRHERTRLAGEVRIYLCDGSGSMLFDGADGARARVRDALLVAELASLLARYEQRERYTRLVLYYRYFDDEPGPLVRVDAPDEALAAVADVVGTPREGGTDIERALGTCIELVQAAQAEDAELQRAHVVLVTDGQASVSEGAVTALRERAGGVPVAISVIALGEENPALRAIVARQRARGERAFYHYTDDDTLAAICAGRLERRRPIHAPARGPSLKALAREVGALCDDLAAERTSRHAALRSQEAAEVARGVADALGELAEVAGSDAPDLRVAQDEQREGARALAEAADRDARAIERRFARFFPAPGEPDGPRGSSMSHAEAVDDDAGSARFDRDAEDAALVVVATVHELVSELGAERLERMADAIDLLERLLPDAGLTPARFHATIASGPPALREALRLLHEDMGGG